MGISGFISLSYLKVRFDPLDWGKKNRSSQYPIHPKHRYLAWYSTRLQPRLGLGNNQSYQSPLEAGSSYFALVYQVA